MRILKYLLFAILTIVTPYVTTMLLIIVSMDRIEGMKLGVMPGVILPHLIFGLVFIGRSRIIKIFLTIVVTAIIYGLVIVVIRLDMIRTGFDLYRFWDLILINFIVGLIIWEIFYQMNTVINKKIKTSST